jgi:hypothetical protein
VVGTVTSAWVRLKKGEDSGALCVWGGGARSALLQGREERNKDETTQFDKREQRQEAKKIDQDQTKQTQQQRAAVDFIILMRSIYFGFISYSYNHTNPPISKSKDQHPPPLLSISVITSLAPPNIPRPSLRLPHFFPLVIFCGTRRNRNNYRGTWSRDSGPLERRRRLRRPGCCGCGCGGGGGLWVRMERGVYVGVCVVVQ